MLAERGDYPALNVTSKAILGKSCSAVGLNVALANGWLLVNYTVLQPPQITVNHRLPRPNYRKNQILLPLESIWTLVLRSETHVELEAATPNQTSRSGQISQIVRAVFILSDLNVTDCI
jgi:hypothetical protein